MNSQHDIIVVGAGVFGCVAARAFIEAGRDVMVFDDRRPMNGSAPSGFLMKPSWINMMPTQDKKESFALLDRLYGVDNIELTLWPLKKKVTATHVERHRILNDPKVPVTELRVGEVQNSGVVVEDPEGQPVSYSAKKVIVAAGVWCNELVNVPGLYGKRGVSFVFPGEIEAFIKPWAPYKQVVAHKHDIPGFFWAGDGTALRTENWTQEREEITADRVANAVKRNKSEATRQHGIRPFVPDVTNKVPCYLHKHDENVWVLTGGGKNGLVASAWAANQLLKVL